MLLRNSKAETHLPRFGFKFLAILLCALLIPALSASAGVKPSTQAAQPQKTASHVNRGFFIKGFAGASIPQTIRSSLDISGGGFSATPTNTTIEFKHGYDAGAAIGFYYCPRLSFEAALMHINSDVDRGTFDIPSAPPPLVASSLNELRVTTYMVNAYYDFLRFNHVTNFIQTINLFAGTGIGSASIRFEVPFTAPPFINDFQASINTFAYQFMLGADFHVTHWLALFVAYHYLRTSNGFGYRVLAGSGANGFTNTHFSAQIINAGLSFQIPNRIGMSRQ